MNFIKSNLELFYLGLGSGAAFLMALLRSGGFTRRDLAMRCTEGAMCSMISSAISVSANVWLGWSYELAMPIGTFVGFVGTTFIHSAIKNWSDAKGITRKTQKDDTDE